MLCSKDFFSHPHPLFLVFNQRKFHLVCCCIFLFKEKMQNKRMRNLFERTTYDDREVKQSLQKEAILFPNFTKGP